MTTMQMADLRRQHDEWERSGYDGHNRRPVKATMADLRARRRRRWHERLRAWARG